MTIIAWIIVCIPSMNVRACACTVYLTMYTANLNIQQCSILGTTHLSNLTTRLAIDFVFKGFVGERTLVEYKNI